MIDINEVRHYKNRNCLMCQKKDGDMIFEYIHNNAVPTLKQNKHLNARFWMHEECWNDAGGSKDLLCDCGHVGVNHIKDKCYGFGISKNNFLKYFYCCFVCYEERFGIDFTFDENDLKLNQNISLPKIV